MVLIFFHQSNNKLVWDETIKIMNGLFNDVWAGKDVVSLDHIAETTLAVCVYFILAIMILLAFLINTNTNH